MSHFPKEARLLRSFEYRTLSKEGDQKVGKYIILSKRFSQKDTRARLGITVSRRYGKAHLRNRFKRMVREAFRSSALPTSLEINVIPRKDAMKARMQDIQAELVGLLATTKNV